MLCHNGEFEQQVLRQGETFTFEALDALLEQCYIDESQIQHLRPSTLEGCVVRVSDMVAYLGKDRQDAIDMGILKDYTLFDSEVIGAVNTSIIHNLTIDIVNNSYGRNYIAMSEDVFKDLKLAKASKLHIFIFNEGFARHRKYCRKHVRGYVLKSF